MRESHCLELMAGRANQSVTVGVDEVKISFLMCSHLHSCIFLGGFVFMFKKKEKKGKKEDGKKENQD